MRNLIVVFFVLSCSSCRKESNTHKAVHRRLDSVATYVAPTNSVVGYK